MGDRKRRRERLRYIDFVCATETERERGRVAGEERDGEIYIQVERVIKLSVWVFFFNKDRVE